MKIVYHGVYGIIQLKLRNSIGESIENYKQYLEKLETENKIITFKNNSSDEIVSFDKEYVKKYWMNGKKLIH